MTPRSRLGRLSAGLAGAAALIGVVTVVSRFVGFGRYLVFSHTVGQTCLGDVYFTANQVTTVAFEALVGGALASMVVPVLSRPIARGDTDETSRIASAWLTWALLVLFPLAIGGIFAARPVMRLLLGGDDGCPGALAVGTRMLLIFLPQLPLYGVAVVLYGVLQAHRRFLGPAAAPLGNSVILIGSYAAYAVLAGDAEWAARLALAVGTTCGVAALAVIAAAPLARTGVRLRPALTFPPGVGRRARGLAGAGIATLVAHQLVELAALWLANNLGSVGSVALYRYSWQLFHLPYAVLAVPVALSAFQALSARTAKGDHAGYVTTAAGTTRAVLLVSFAAAATLAATAGPIARVFLLAAPGDIDPVVMGHAVIAFAPGLVGFALVALVGRALYASGHNRLSAGCVVAGWAAVLAVDVPLALTVPPRWVVTAFGVGNSTGMTIAGASLVAALVWKHGRRAVAGAGRALAAGLAGAAGGYAAGAAVAGAGGDVGVWGSVGVGVAAAVATVAAFLLIAAVADRAGTRELMRRLRVR